ncbi:MAG: T9SS type A sorting domain-containing protein [Terrimonas sp.]|nr:T9SS type A sorting domain-containing protein [Terrimonas sp.]
MKRKILLPLLFVFLFHSLRAQLLSWSPQFAQGNGNITILMDATKGNQALMGFSGNVYVHIGVITNLSANSGDWKHVPYTWGTTPAAAQALPAGPPNRWFYTISNINSFFNLSAGETILKIAILFRDGTGSTVQRNADGSDMFVPLYDNSLSVRFNAPPFEPKYIPVLEPINKQVGESIPVTAVSSTSSDLKLYLNGSLIQTALADTSIQATPVLTVAGNQELVVEATAGANTKKDTLHFFVASAPNIAALPSGVQDGINYEPGDTSIIFVLYAPGKNRVSLIGEFPGSNWSEQTQYVLNKTPDGNRWWRRVTGLTPGTEYAFQYLVDGNLKTTDPYCEKILDPWNDGSIPAATYPGLKPYPAAATGIVGVVQPGKPAYNWHVNNFSRPDKRNLMIYEMLMRDFTAAHDWKTMTDTLNYLKHLGINAVEVMPLNEFEGNSSWGYNPDFFLAPDKYYGPANDFKRFIDSCHSKGIAVIMDIALNHATGLCPLAALYWDGANNRPAANNPWFNQVATHPFSVFNDFNHESQPTKYFFKRVTEHWLQQYKIDGFRFDLSKGFTQTNSGNDVNAWSSYDASRVAIWKSYYDTLQSRAPGSYAILEHFAVNAEEQELSNYGMLLWGNANYNFTAAAKGDLPNSNFEYALHTVRGWNNPYLVSYMESHDEERVMYNTLQSGLGSGSYNTKDLNTALKRSEMCASFLTMMPGPKMIWEFGEQGYDYSINYCTNGTINNNCRLDPKPIRWDYLQDASRKGLHDVYGKLFSLRNHPLYKNGFLTNSVDKNLTGAFKWLKITTDTSNLLVVGNFDVIPQAGTVTFQSAGTWYDYLDNSTVSATGTAQTLTLQPGEYHVYINRNINNVSTTAVSNLYYNGNPLQAKIYPNPSSGTTIFANLNIPETGNVLIELLHINGQKIETLQNKFLAKGEYMVTLGLGKQPVSGNYIISVKTKHYSNYIKFVVQ